MKTRIALLLLACLLPMAPAAGQSSEVPGLISYQGIVTDAAGNLVGETTPTNRNVIFRIWNSPSSFDPANLVYSETQVATISKGEFSVLIGSGVAVVGEEVKGPGTVALNQAFAAKDRYLGVSIDDGSGNLVEISPRQQIVSTAFALRAKEAETIVNDAVGTDAISDGSVTLAKMAAGSVDATHIVNNSIQTTNLSNGAVTSDKLGNGSVVAGKVANNAIVSSNIVDGSVATSDLASGAVTEAKLATNSISTAKLLNGAVTAAKLGSDVGNWSVSGSNIYRNGRVGVGTNSPQGYLSVTGVNPQTVPTAQGVHMGRVLYGGNQDTSVTIRSGAGGGSQLLFYNEGHSGSGRLWMVENSKEMRFDGASKVTFNVPNVGIGTTNPTRAKLEVSGFVSSNPASAPGSANPGLYPYWYSNSGNPAWTLSAVNKNISIHASDVVSANQFAAFSDERIKSVVGRSDSAVDLDKLSRIEITDYTYIDVATKGPEVQKKVIAQQVEEILPQAVSTIKDAVPDIYQRARLTEGWIELANDLKKGERVRVITENETAEYAVIEVEEDRFRTELVGPDQKVFVYGREVDDFRMVDYEAISMLNVSATQELHRRLEASESEVESLKQELSELKARDAARDERLSAIEKMLKPAEEDGLRTVSTEAR